MQENIIGARCVISGVNYKSVPDIYREAMESGFDYAVFIPVVDYENKGFSLKEREIDYLLGKLLNMPIDAGKTNLPALIERKFLYYTNSYDTASATDGCASLGYRTNAFINYDGGVYTCQPHIADQDYCIGNIENQSFANIWNGRRHQEVIENLHAEWKNGVCANCRCIAYNRIIGEYAATGNNVPLTIVKDCFL